MSATAVIAGLFSAAPAGAAVVTCDGQRATIVGTTGNDVIVGTSHNDVIAALGGRDAVHGLGGSDIICGGQDADRIWAGSGNDQLFGGRDSVYELNGRTHADGDVLDGGPGDDRLVGGSDSRRAHCYVEELCGRDTISWKTATRSVTVNIALGLASSGRERDTFDRENIEVQGSPYDDYFYGTQYADWVSTSGGADFVQTNAGDDMVFVDPSPLSPNGKTAGVWTGPGDDKIIVRGGPTGVHAGIGNDDIEDLSASNTVIQLFGDSGDDSIHAGLVPTTQFQRMAGGSGLDVLDVAGSADQQSDYHATWDMSTGVMTVDTPGGGHLTTTADHFENARLGGVPWTIDGTLGANAIQAKDTLGTAFTGHAGNDTFVGSPSGDTFDGGDGTDVSFGMGAGTDTCISVEVFYAADCENVTP
jgi:hypothetical protein